MKMSPQRICFPKIDIFGQIASTSIKHAQLTDGGNPKYTLRDVLEGVGFNMGITPRSCQCHLK